MNIEHFTVPDEQGANAHYPELMVSIDDDGDVWLTNEEGSLLLSLNQAFILHFNLGQMLVGNARNTYGRQTYAGLAYAAMEQAKHG